MAAEILDRKQLISLLNEDLSREYQAVISYVIYSQVLKGAQYMKIATELESHAKEELDHARRKYPNRSTTWAACHSHPQPVKLSEKGRGHAPRRP